MIMLWISGCFFWCAFAGLTAGFQKNAEPQEFYEIIFEAIFWPLLGWTLLHYVVGSAFSKNAPPKQ